MSVDISALEASIMQRVDSALQAGANFLADKLVDILSVQAPVAVGPSGRVYATTFATPGAPPRRVTGDLQSSIVTMRPEPGHWFVGSVGVYYAFPLEYVMNHAFVSVVLEENYTELERVITGALAGGI
jgi:hypothetical protein